MNINEKIVARIKELQNKRNWSNNHLAMEAGISAATITNWYKRKAVPSIRAIDSLCKAFGITKGEFFNESDSTAELTAEQQELLTEWDLLHSEQKKYLLALIKSTNDIVRSSNAL